jgi:hypothetical protein
VKRKSNSEEKRKKERKCWWRNEILRPQSSVCRRPVMAILNQYNQPRGEIMWRGGGNRKSENSIENGNVNAIIIP